MTDLLGSRRLEDVQIWRSSFSLGLISNFLPRVPSWQEIVAHTMWVTHQLYLALDTINPNGLVLCASRELNW
jgi:hypothetical protein